MAIKAGLIGYPVSHTLSPRIHQYWLKKHGIKGSYEAVEVTQYELEDFVNQMAENGFSGLNVTIPHKVEVYNMLKNKGKVTARAEEIGAVNTIYIRDEIIYGDNTDSYGFIENIRQNAKDWEFTGKNVILLGAGGAARAIVAGLLAEKAGKITVINRTMKKAGELKDHFMGNIAIDYPSRLSEVMKESPPDLFINGTSKGMQGHDDLNVSLDNLPAHAIVTDIVYNPLETTLLRTAAEKGNMTIDGLGMLLHQAVAGFEKWFGVKPSVDEDLRKYVLAQDDKEQGLENSA